MERISVLAGRGSSAEDKIKMSGQARVAEAELVSARSARHLAEHNLYRSQVRAPYAGQINQRRVTPGTYLEDKTVIATMADLSRLRLVGYIPEKAAPLVRQMLVQEEITRLAYPAGSIAAGIWPALLATGLVAENESPAAFRLEFELRPFPKTTFYGRIFYLSTVASPDTHMFECKAEVPLRGLEGDLRPGYTARIRCPLPGRGDSLVIPEEAVRATEQGDIVFRPRPVYTPDGKVEYVAEAVPLQLGIRRPGSVEVLRVMEKNEAARGSRMMQALAKADQEGVTEILKGLKVGDWIVRKGAESLENGTPIAIPEAQLKELASR
jgi:multidrug efflux pump subunit AcrA (membrane-fusion protein)